MNAFKVNFSLFGLVWFLAIFSFGSWETPTFLAFPDLARPRRLTSFNILPGIVFLYFWRGINWPQLTVFRFYSFYQDLTEKIETIDAIVQHYCIAPCLSFRASIA